MSITKELIREIPKSDLHVHLDGSMRISTLIELAHARGVSLPSDTESGLRELVFKEGYASLVEYLKGFSYTVAVLQDAEALERVAAELAEDCLAEGVLYLEVRFAPQLHVNSKLSMREVFESVNRGLARVQKSYNNLPAVLQGSVPPFHYGIIVCAMRMFTKEFSSYYSNFCNALQYSSTQSIASLASKELAYAAILMRDTYGIPVVGFDLAGQEAGYPADAHFKAYQHVHKHFLKKTVHAGEAYGPESIFQAITDLHADRLGHGYHLYSVDRFTDPLPLEQRQRYVNDLVQYIADRRITIEVCLTSNMQTMPELKDIKNHAFAKMLESRLSTTFCTDNRTVSNTTVSKEIELAVNAFNLPLSELRNLIIYGFKRSFFHGTYQEKRKYVRQIIDYYDAVIQKHQSVSQQ